jgi:hypothetical protein
VREFEQRRRGLQRWGWRREHVERREYVEWREREHVERWEHIE